MVGFSIVMFVFPGVTEVGYIDRRVLPFLDRSNYCTTVRGPVIEWLNLFKPSWDGNPY